MIPTHTAFFIVLEPGDTSEHIESATGYAPLKSLFSDAHYGDPEFMPDFEYLEDHAANFSRRFTSSTTAVLPWF